MTNTTTGVATLKQLNKECLNIDLSKVRLKEWKDEPLDNSYFYTDKNGENPYIKLGNSRSYRYNIGLRDFFWIDQYAGIERKTWEEHRENRNIEAATFTGGKQGRYGSVHTDFTGVKIMFDISTDEILGVLYALDNDYLNEWLRQTIDPNIPSNWDELHADKEFEVLITTTTFSTEKVKVVGRSYDECLETMKQNDPMLSVGLAFNRMFSGMKTTSTREGAKPIPSSYEEWVSLQEKEAA
jgi:hypothetical protein